MVASASLVSGLYINGSVIAPCDSPIYCHGEILKQIELARPFSDSKTFVDMYVTQLPLHMLFFDTNKWKKAGKEVLGRN